ncbi:methyltransferase domain-containing protein [Sphingobium algorifonticola]|nr:methyltransferase domain-containing protein [Sphingobium algorifonticola]
MSRDLSTRALEEEQMDAETLSPVVYAQVLAGLARINTATLTARPTIRFLKRAATGPFRLLDVGYGDGGMLRAIWRWAGKHGIACDLVGIDLNPRSEAVALARHPAQAPITYRTGDYAALADEPWDFIISSLVTHHMDDPQRSAFLRFMEATARRGWFVNDLHRHALAYHGYPWAARLLGVHRIVREDGQLSIARSFRPAEWHDMLNAAELDGIATVERLFPFRLCVSRIK